MKFFLATIAVLLFSCFAFGQQSDEQMFNELKQLFKEALNDFSQIRGKIISQDANEIVYAVNKNYFQSAGFTAKITYYIGARMYELSMSGKSEAARKTTELIVIIFSTDLIQKIKSPDSKAESAQRDGLNLTNEFFDGKERVAQTIQNDTAKEYYFFLYSNPPFWIKANDSVSQIDWSIMELEIRMSIFSKPFIEFPANPNQSETKNDDSKDYQALLKQCNEFYEKEDYPKAIEACTEAIKLKNDNPLLYQIRGLSYFFTPDKPKSGLDALTSIGSANKYAAIADLTKCTQLEPTKPECFYALGYVQRKTLETDKLDKSAKSFSEAIRLKSTEEDVYYQRAEAYREYYSRDDFFGNKETQIRQRKELAVADYTKDIELRPTAIESRVGRGLVYLDLEKYNLSVTDFTKALDILNASGKQNPDYRKGILENRARAYLNLGKNTEYCNDMKALGKTCEK
ncbi:MAG TPA: hypothetical protein PKY82_05050 [Pyrinomonadaceae bacterium]|nr:hypothetical protein [Pyrinomonadaceae bacterium]